MYPAKDNQITIDQWGLNIKDSLIWLDSLSCHETTIISSYFKIISHLPNRFNGRYLISPEIFALVETITKNSQLSRHLSLFRPTICEYNHPFSIGIYQLEFLQFSGCGLGDSSVHILSDDVDLIYMPNPRITLPSLFSHPTQTNTCSSLYLQADCSDLLQSKKFDKLKEISKIIDFCQKYLTKHNRYPVIICEKFGLAQELCFFIAKENIKLLVHGSIAKINQVYEKFGYNLGQYQRFTLNRYEKKFTDHFLIFPDQKSKISLPKDLDKIYIAGDYQSFCQKKIDSQYISTFLVNQLSELEDLNLIIETTKPKKLYLSGYHALHYQDLLSSHNIDIKVIFPKNQPTLFDLTKKYLKNT